MKNDDMLALDGAFKRLARAQGTIARLADEGIEKTMTHGDRAPWGDFASRLSAARREGEAAFGALGSLYASLIEGPAGG